MAAKARLERVLHDEDKGIGFSRGLTPDGCQTFDTGSCCQSSDLAASELRFKKRQRVFCGTNQGDVLAARHSGAASKWQLGLIEAEYLMGSGNCLQEDSNSCTYVHAYVPLYVCVVLACPRLCRTVREFSCKHAGPGNIAHFRQELGKVFVDVQQTQDTIRRRDPPKPISQDVAQMSQHRCNVQMLVDAMVNAVMRGAGDVLQVRSSFNWFWGMGPAGGVGALPHPIFYKDQDGISHPNGLAWSSTLAYGAELRVCGIGLPTGFEWHLGLLELMTFSLLWRFQGSVVLAAGLAYALNKCVLALYSAAGRSRLAHTTIINSMFLI